MLRAEVIRPIPELLAEVGARHAGHIAVSDRDRSITYDQLARRTANLAGQLRAAGVVDGDTVLLFCRNGVTVVEGYLAAIRANAVAVCLYADSTADDLAFVLADCGPRVIITDAPREQLVRAALAELDQAPLLVVDGADDGLADLVERSDVPPPDTLALDAPAFMFYTSGATGHPKGVLLSQRGMLWVVAAGWLPFLGLNPDDVVLNPLPLSHSYPLDVALAALCAGARMHVQERFSTTETHELLATLPVTVLLGVPTTYAYLLDAGSVPRKLLRLCVTAGAAPPRDLADRVEQTFGSPLVDAYGTTETSTVIAMTAPGVARPPSSCGVAVIASTCRVVDPITAVDVPEGEEGELIVRSPGVMIGYHNQPQETARVLRNGWYHTGDLARRDAAGFLTITGRLNDIIIRGGENIAPAEIEQVAGRHPGVRDCAVAGRADSLLGEVPVLFVTARDDTFLDSEDLLGWCRDRLPKYKVPVEVRLVDTISRTSSGKIKRHELPLDV